MDGNKGPSYDKEVTFLLRKPDINLRETRGWRNLIQRRLSYRILLRNGEFSKRASELEVFSCFLLPPLWLNHAIKSLSTFLYIDEFLSWRLPLYLIAWFYYYCYCLCVWVVLVCLWNNFRPCCYLGEQGFLHGGDNVSTGATMIRTWGSNMCDASRSGKDSF